MRKYSLLLVFIMILSFVIVPIGSAWAGNVQRNRWEGVAIGIGAAIMGKVIWDNIHQGHPERVYVQPRPRPRVQYYYQLRPQPSGHWEVRKIWIPPAYKEVWNPGHYNRREKWVSGRWLNIEISPGYWKKERVWVTEDCYYTEID